MLDRGWCENFQCFCSISCKKCGFIASGPVWICSKICILCFFYFAFAFCVFYFVFLSCILTGKDCHRISDDESQVATGDQDLPRSDFCHFQHTICNFLTTYHCPPLVWGFILRLSISRCHCEILWEKSADHGNASSVFVTERDFRGSEVSFWCLKENLPMSSSSLLRKFSVFLRDNAR